MSFDTYEASQEQGQPVEVYEIALGGDVYRYTSDVADVVLGGHTYEATPISRGRIVVGKEEQTSDRIEVTMPASDPFALLYVNSVPGKKATLTVSRFHRGDPAQETVVVFKGSVATIRFVDGGTSAKLTVLSITVAQSRPVPRMAYQGLCNHLLYDGRCGISETAAAWRKTFTVTAVSGNVITVPGAAACGADFFAAGFVSFSGDYRLVVSQSGDALTLSTPFSISPLNQQVTVNAGCKHRVVDCQTKFNNVANYGGFPFVPLKNPFESGL